MEGIKREVYLARFYTRPTFMFFSLAFSGMCQSIFGHSRSHLLSKSIRAWPSVCVFFHESWISHTYHQERQQPKRHKSTGLENWPEMSHRRDSPKMGYFESGCSRGGIFVSISSSSIVRPYKWHTWPCSLLLSTSFVQGCGFFDRIVVEEPVLCLQNT